MITYEVSGSTRRLEAFLTKARNLDIRPYLRSGAEAGVLALRKATPVDEGIAQAGWYYKIEARRGLYRIDWCNHDIESGFPVVIRLQYGYSTGTGGYVHGRDFINPAIRPIFDKIADDVWKAVKSL